MRDECTRTRAVRCAEVSPLASEWERESTRSCYVSQILPAYVRVELHLSLGSKSGLHEPVEYNYEYVVSAPNDFVVLRTSTASNVR